MVVTFIGLLGLRESNAQTLYDINFSQLPYGPYTNASGPPNDFSSYFVSGSDPSGVSSYIFPSFLSLTNRPLYCTTDSEGTGNFLMQMGNVSSNAVTLTMQLMLDPAVGTTVGFGQSGSAGSTVTSIILEFSDIATNTMQVQSVDGPTNSPAVLYTFATSVVRSNVQNISFSLNLPAHAFSLSVNGVSLASNAPIGSSQPLNQAAIAIGDVDGIDNGGAAAINNIVLTAAPAVSISNIFFSGANVMVGLITSTNAYYDIQTTTDLVSAPWSTIYSNIPGVEGLTNLNCGPAAGPQQFFRADAHP